MKQRGPKQQPHPAASESHYEATAGFYQVNSQLYRITSLLILTGSMTTSGRELTLLLALYSPPLTAPLYWPQPLGAIIASRRSSTAVRCPPLLPLPSFSPFSLFFSFFPGCFQKQASATEKPQGSSRPFDSLHPPRPRLEEARPYFEPPLLGCFPLQTHMYIFSSSLLLYN